MDVKLLVSALFGRSDKQRGKVTAAELAAAIAKAPGELANAEVAVARAQERLDGLLADRDVGNSVPDRELDAARRDLDEANATVRGIRVFLHRAKAQHAATAAAEERAQHDERGRALRAAIVEHERALSEFDAWAAACPFDRLRRTLAAVAEFAPASVVADGGLGPYRATLRALAEQRLLALTGGNFPGLYVIAPRSWPAFEQAHRPPVERFAREADEAIRRHEAAAPRSSATKAA